MNTFPKLEITAGIVWMWAIILFTESGDTLRVDMGRQDLVEL